MCEETVANLRWALDKDVPIFGICLGNQVRGMHAFLGRGLPFSPLVYLCEVCPVSS